jgi:hypothetical protein
MTDGGKNLYGVFSVRSGGRMLMVGPPREPLLTWMISTTETPEKIRILSGDFGKSKSKLNRTGTENFNFFALASTLQTKITLFLHNCLFFVIICYSPTMACKGKKSH